MDKQDELAAAICAARIGVELPEGADIEPSDDDLRTAAAVRSLMGSPEAVERAAKEIAGEVALRPWADMAENRSDQRARIKEGLDVNEPNRMDCRDAYRAALSAAIGEDIGGGSG